jgi:hypothetical protein
MQSPLYTKLAPVQRRQRWLFALRTAVLGLLAGSLGGIGLGLARALAGWPIAPWAAAAVLASGPLVGALVGLVWPRGWRAAAAAVDAHYRLKDRSTTALAFAIRPSVTVLHQLQVHDAVEHLTGVASRQVVPLRLPRTLPYAVGAFAVAVTLLVWPLGSQVVDAGLPEPPPAIVAEAERILEDLKDFDELARQDQNQELQQLVQELREKAEEMKQPGVDLREALAKLSEMQAAILAQQAQYNVGLVDGQLQSLGSAMSAATPLQGAGKALQEAKYEKAAKELEEMEDPQFDRKEAKALEEKLKQVAKEMADVGLGQMSEAASEMAEGAKGGKGKFQKGARELARQVRSHERRRHINQLLTAEMERLNEGKCNCQANSLVKGKNPYKSLSPSSTFGMETSGNVEGTKTNLLAQRNLEQVTGNPGEGPAEVETTHSAEGRQQAGRAYRDVYNQYRRMSEAVLDSEPIPLGHRRTIRRYFELIRPQTGNGEKGDQ